MNPKNPFWTWKHRPLREDNPDKQTAALANPPFPILQRWAVWIWGLLIVAATLAAYSPALFGDFVFDDNNWTTGVEELLLDFSGLWRIWTDPTALQQYYPLTGTTFWMDYHLWHWWTLPYHVENVLLHASCALLLWRLLWKLEVPGAWLTGAIFALHPVMVESTAWIAERKNVLSMLLFLASILLYGNFTSFWKVKEPSHRRAWTYVLALLLFLGALLSKITTFALPPVLLLICWWKRGRIRWREDVLPTLPFFALSIGLGLLVTWLEKHQVGAEGAEWELNWAERILVAGRVPWFYLEKLLWPVDQCLVYPRWHLEAGSLWQWLFPLGSLTLLGVVWLLRGRLGRGPAVAMFYYAGTLFPVLGLMNFYWMRFSFVGDHLVYLSSPAVLAFCAAVAVRFAAYVRRPLLLSGLALLLLLGCACLTWRESGQYKDVETIWRTTVSRNPACWLAHANLGNVFYENGQVDGAIAHYRKALGMNPNYDHAHYNLSAALTKRGQVDEAIAHYQKTLEINPDYAQAHNNLGILLVQKGQVSEAIGHYEKALDIKPNFAQTHYNLGNALNRSGRVSEALGHYELAIIINPLDLGSLNILAWILATSPEPTLRNGTRALEVARRASQLSGGNHPIILHTLGAAYAECGRFPEALENAERALSLAESQGNSSLAAALRNERSLYQSGKPFRQIRSAVESATPVVP